MKFISEVGSSYLKYPLGEVMGEGKMRDLKKKKRTKFFEGTAGWRK
jgi:hypothetical protein